MSIEESSSAPEPVPVITPFRRVAVIGGGAWGSALAMVADRAGRETRLWIREAEAVAAIRAGGRNPFLPDHDMPAGISVTGDMAEALAGADLALLVIPSQFLRAMAAEVERHAAPGMPVVICSKGIERDTGLLMTQVIAEVMPGRPQAVLSGPSFAAEVAEGQPTAVTIASADVQPLDDDEDGPLDPESMGAALVASLAARVAVTLGTTSFRPYLSDDLTGVEVGGAVKNVLAIACGIAAGRGLGSNPRAAIITRGLAELKRLAQALGGRRETVTGLAGIGDLTLTCSSEQSRNFTFGLALGRGATPDEALAGKSAVVEGAVNAETVTALARRLGVEMPISEAVHAIIRGRLDIDAAMTALLTRPIRAESRALEPVVAIDHPASRASDLETTDA
ncbi:NAD(P)H-dependent glycerol-3-phosphate dehydrogenase [uncultured Tistrella sp.]|uniref:NAD(P)H-dependent glycerol-3-phosphate dehydrogenase n=1 Tax=Tistrella mobilis TaxID=171437 RepID=UPI000C0A960E|nr:NAD(P)H-dependent glycerol-3-phosphate dehydrogenase [uncultured Tistrella sp.]MAM75729.1 glycerol-3-phosphate dehydrogenase [Tistrella sp.]